LLYKLEGKEAEYAELEQSAAAAQANLSAVDESIAKPTDAVTVAEPVVDTAALAELEGEKAEL
jgi:hypothetical protein